MRKLQRILYLRCCVGEDLGVGIGSGACNIPAIREQVGSAPKQSRATGLHALGQKFTNPPHIQI